MLRTIMTAALLLALPLTTAGCGQGSTSAAQSSREDTHQTDGTYQADDQGRVSGSENDRDKDRDQDRSDLGDDLKKAGEDLTRDAKDAARDAGDAAKGVLDGVTDDPNENSSLNAGNSSDPPVENK